MDPVLQSFQLFLTLVRGLILRARALGGPRETTFGSKALARRMRRAVRMVEAYLRRVLIAMALEIEPTLVDRSKAVERRKDRKVRMRMALPRFVVLNDQGAPFPEDGLAVREARPIRKGRRLPAQVPLGRMYRRLDRLAAIAGAPLGRARRLAFHLARYRHGPILAPDLRLRMPNGWGTEAGASFEAMAALIVRNSFHRPPPLPPPKRWGPSVTILDW